MQQHPNLTLSEPPEAEEEERCEEDCIGAKKEGEGGWGYVTKATEKRTNEERKEQL